MEINHTKAALLAYLKEEGLINAIKECETLSDVMGALWVQPEAYYSQLGDRWPEILSKTVSPDLLENYGMVINDNYYGSMLLVQDYNMTAAEIVPLLYIQNTQLQHMVKAEQLAKVQDRIADRLPRWVLANALPHTENVSSRAQTSRMSR